MPARHVAPKTAAAHEDRAGSRLQIQNRHLRGIESAPERHDREEHRAAARQPLRPDVVGFALRRVGPREHGRRSTRGRDTLQSGRGIAGGRDDRVIRSPCRASRRAIETCQRERRSARHRHLLQRTTLHEPDPLAVGGDERLAQFSGGEHHRGLEGIKRTDEELGAVVAHVDDARAIGRNRQGSVAGEAQCRGPCVRNVQPRDA